MCFFPSLKLERLHKFLQAHAKNVNFSSTCWTDFSWLSSDYCMNEAYYWVMTDHVIVPIKGQQVPILSTSEWFVKVFQEFPQIVP